MSLAHSTGVSPHIHLRCPWIKQHDGPLRWLYLYAITCKTFRTSPSRETYSHQFSIVASSAELTSRLSCLSLGRSGSAGVSKFNVVYVPSTSCIVC